MSKNICRLDGNPIFLSVLRDDEEAVGLYAKWMSDETTCVFIEHAHSVVDITRMPGWVRDHSVMRMGIVLKETDTLIGYCHIDHRTEDMSAWLSINIGEKSVRGKGIGTEVSADNHIVLFAFTISFRRTGPYPYNMQPTL